MLDATGGYGQVVDLINLTDRRNVACAVAVASRGVTDGAVQLEGSSDGSSWQAVGQPTVLEGGAGVTLEIGMKRFKHARLVVTDPVIGGTVTVVFVP